MATKKGQIKKLWPGDKPKGDFWPLAVERAYNVCNVTYSRLSKHGVIDVFKVE